MQIYWVLGSSDDGEAVSVWLFNFNFILNSNNILIEGAPVDLSPNQDDPVLAADPQRNNNFDFSSVKDQTNCPFAAHIRKNNPRSDLPA